jgi:hypothetical protein
MSKYPVIQTPKGQILVNNDTMKAELIFYTDSFTGVKRGGPGAGFGGAQSWQGTFHAAQWFVDNEVLRLCDPFIPLKTSMLIKSGILGTDVGSGVVSWIAPYAKYQYYGLVMAGTPRAVTGKKLVYHGGPLRGSFWFERMKQIYKKRILKGAKKIVREGKK